MRPCLLALLLMPVLLTGGCSSDGETPGVQPAPAASPSASSGGGFLSTTRCNAYRVQIESNQRTLSLEEAAGHSAEAAALRAKIDADLQAAQSVSSCNLRDLSRP